MRKAEAVELYDAHIVIAPQEYDNVGLVPIMAPALFDDRDQSERYFTMGNYERETGAEIKSIMARITKTGIDIRVVTNYGVREFTYSGAYGVEWGRGDA